jgi:hypothetical protein
VVQRRDPVAVATGGWVDIVTVSDTPEKRSEYLQHWSQLLPRLDRQCRVVARTDEVLLDTGGAR